MLTKEDIKYMEKKRSEILFVAGCVPLTSFRWLAALIPQGKF